jgi:hypothetical protein
MRFSIRDPTQNFLSLFFEDEGSVMDMGIYCIDFGNVLKKE